MKTFLQIVAEDVFGRYGADLSRVAVVFPNKRAGLFFNEALSELIREKTVIVIAHRMRTIRSADKIVLLNNGEIEAIGNDKEMYERSAAYRKMLSDSKIEQTVTVN